MHAADRWLQSTVGLKITMGVTGLFLVVFVVFHVLANLFVFWGRASLDAVASVLDTSATFVLAARAALFVAVVLHVWAALRLMRIAHAARPVAYAKKVPQAATFASRTMRVGGVVLLVFLIVHVLHLATGTIQPLPAPPADLYDEVVGGFRVPWIAAFYLACLVVLGSHLFHGVWAAFRSVGASPPSPQPMRRRVALVVALCVWAGFTAIPIAALAGVLR